MVLSSVIKNEVFYEYQIPKVKFKNLCFEYLIFLIKYSLNNFFYIHYY